MKQSVSSRIVTHRFHLKSWFLHRIRSCQDYSMEDWLRNDAEKTHECLQTLARQLRLNHCHEWLASTSVLGSMICSIIGFNQLSSIPIIAWWQCWSRVKDTVFSNRINTNLERKHNRLVNLTLQWPTHKSFFIKLTHMVTFHLKN